MNKLYCFRKSPMPRRFQASHSIYMYHEKPGFIDSVQTREAGEVKRCIGEREVKSIVLDMAKRAGFCDGNFYFLILAVHQKGDIHLR